MQQLFREEESYLNHGSVHFVNGIEQGILKSRNSAIGTLPLLHVVKFVRLTWTDSCNPSPKTDWSKSMTRS